MHELTSLAILLKIQMLVIITAVVPISLLVTDGINMKKTAAKELNFIPLRKP